MADTFEVLDEVNRQYRRFSAQGTQFTVRLLPPPDDDDSQIDPITHFESSMNALFDYALRNVDDSDMVGLVIQNESTNDNTQKDKPIGFSFRRKDQLSTEVIWRLFEKVNQSNARFNAMDKLVVTVHSVKLPVGFGRVKTKGRQIDNLAHLKQSIVRVDADTNCLAHALVIAIAKVNNDPNYNSYRRGYKIHPEVHRLLETTGIDLSNGGGIPELERFQDHFGDQYKIVVYTGLNCDAIMFEGLVDSPKRINLLYDDVTRHYHVINSLTGAMAKQYVCTACNKGCRRDVTHVCDQICSDCRQSPPCIFAGTRVPCAACNRHFRSQTCFDNHKKPPGGKKKTICERVRRCATCDEIIIIDDKSKKQKHECHKRFCKNCGCNRETGHLCYMAPLAPEMPSSDKVLYVFYDFETTQDTPISDTATVHVPNLVCVQQFCTLCEGELDIERDCERCGKRKHILGGGSCR